MKTIDLKETDHVFIKQNLMTLRDSKGPYDLMICENCGLEGKVRQLGQLETTSRRKDPAKCPKAKKVKKIQITHCSAMGSVFANLTPGSIHEVVETPKGENNSRGVWVMGVGEPVKVLFSEFKEV